MLDNETWTQCPVTPNFSVDDVKEFIECLSPSSPSSSSSPTPSSTSQQPSQSLPKIPKSNFGAIVTNGNPFSKMIQYQKRSSAPAHAIAAAAAAHAQANRSRAKSATLKSLNPSSVFLQSRARSNSANISNSSNPSNSANKAAEDDDSDDDVPAELRADYIDEESEGPAVPRKRVESAQATPSTSLKGPLIAPTTISFVRLFAKYVHLLRVLQSSLGLEVFVAAVQLVEYFIYTIFFLFGNPPPGYGFSTDDLLAGMTPGLRRMVNKLKERFAPPAPVPFPVSLPDPRESSSAKAGTSGAGNSPHDLVKIKWTLVRLTPAQASEITQAKNGFGIGIRTVAIESLAFLFEALTKAKSALQPLIPVTASEFFSTFYANVGLIPELRVIMYKAVTSGLLATESIGKSVENSKWDTSLVRLISLFFLFFYFFFLLFHDVVLIFLQVKVETSEYVDKLLKEYVQFGQRLDKAITLPPKVKTNIWEAAIIRGIEVVVDAYSKIKKCTNEGRANMMQDIHQSNINKSNHYFDKSEILIPCREESNI